MLSIRQIGRKFRDEMRPKSGLLRCREFEMKGMYLKVFFVSLGTLDYRINFAMIVHKRHYNDPRVNFLITHRSFKY